MCRTGWTGTGPGGQNYPVRLQRRPAKGFRLRTGLDRIKPVSILCKRT